MLISTTSHLQDRTIEQYLGIVTSEAIIGANLFKDLFASITDIVGGRSGAYERTLREAQEVALQELESRATNMGANGIIGVDLDYETVGSQGAMLMVTVSGTAVVYR